MRRSLSNGNPRSTPSAIFLFYYDLISYAVSVNESPEHNSLELKDVGPSRSAHLPRSAESRTVLPRREAANLAAFALYHRLRQLEDAKRREENMTEVQFAKQFLTTLDSKTSKYQSDHVFDPKTFQLRIPYTLPKLSHPPHPLAPKSKPASVPAPGSEPVTQPTPTINITLKSSRNPNFTLHLPSLPPSTPIAALKAQVQSLFSGSVPTEKIKILYNKKPTPASKSTVHDVLSSAAQEGSSEAEFGVMIMGGAPDPTPNVQTVNLANVIESPVPAPGPGSENAAVEAEMGVNPELAMKDIQPSTTAIVEAATNVLENTSQEQGTPVQPGEMSGKDVLNTEEFWIDLQGFLEQRLRDADEARRLVGTFKKVSQ